MSKVAQPKDVQTTLRYYLEIADGGTGISYPGTAGDKRRKHNPVDVLIRDMRGPDQAFTLDTHGFELVSHTAVEKPFTDEETVKEKYYQEIIGLMKSVTGATRVHPFSHIIRRETTETALADGEKKSDPEVVQKMSPARYIHVDQSYDGAEQVLRDNAPPPGAETLGKTRWGIINAWRAIGRPVTREPLAVADARSVAEGDLRAVWAQLPRKGAGTFDNVSKGPGFELWNVAASKEHRWYYASQMTPEDVLMIKCFDSKRDGRARRSPHTAFATDEDFGPARQSIEARCLVFWEDESTE